MTISTPTTPASLSLMTRGVALAYGGLCHAAFLAGVGAMVLGLYTGLQSGLLQLEGWPALALDAVLVLQFPFFHSFLLSSRGRPWLAKLAPAALSRDLGTTLYATFASLQVLTVFALWSPSGVVWWEASGALRWVLTGLHAGSWLLVVKTMQDAGLGIQMGFKGWLALARGRRPVYEGFPTGGSFRYCRQPVYAAFALTLWTSPVLTPDRLALAVLWTGYCVLGPRLKEQRYLDRYGEDYRRYQARTSYWLPGRPALAEVA
jgi:protein-S-isoprenylcysteine O-methyltransferase Ste14